MSELHLLQATEANGLWDKLRISWERQLKQHSAPAEWAGPHLDHAETIVKENGKDKRYGIFVVCGGKAKAAHVGPFEGFVHINFKLMHTSAAEIRLVVNRIAPKYQFEDDRAKVGLIQATFITGAIKMALQHSKKPGVKTPGIKMFLGSPTDLAFGKNFALFVSKMPGMTWNASIKKNWLHLTLG